MREIRTEGSAFEQSLVRDAVRRLNESTSLAPAIKSLEALGIEVAVRFPPGQTEDGLLSWHDGKAIASLAQRYTLANLDQLPAVLAHEVLGHALWGARAHRQNVHAAVRFHINGELIALVTGWIAALELGFEPVHPRALEDFSSDPERFARDLPLRSPHYVLLLSTEEMRHVRRCLQDRLNVLTREWIYLRSNALSADEVVAREEALGEMIRVVTETLGNLDHENGQASETWFANNARCDLVRDLDRSTRIAGNHLRTLLRRP